MADHDPDHEPDYDDWFDEPLPPPEPRRRGSRHAPVAEPDEDAWTAPPRARERERGRRPGAQPIVLGGRAFTPKQAGIAVASIVVLFLAILAAAGVFSSGGNKATPPLPTTPHTISTPTTPATTPKTPTTPTVQAPTTTLKPGDTGPQVKRLQRVLALLKYSPGKPDGDYGPGTKQAVMSFQTAQGLTADGIVGPQTLAALKSALAGAGG